MMRVSSIHELGQIVNNALCFSLYWPFDFFVFLTKLMIVRPILLTDATNPRYDKYLDVFGFVLVSRNN